MKNVAVSILILSIMGCSAPSRVTKHMNAYSIMLPKNDLLVMFIGKNVEVLSEKISPSGDGAYFLFSNKEDNFTFSFYIERAPLNAKSSKDCRDIAWERMAPMLKAQKATDLKTNDLNGYYSFEYLIPESGGYPIKQKHLNVHYYNAGYWVDLHISKVNYKSSDDILFWDFIKKVNI